MSVPIMGTLPNIDVIAMSTSTMLSTRIGIGHFVVSKPFYSQSRIYNIIFLIFPQINSGDLEVTVEFLVEMDKLVQLIESPIFACKSNELTLVHSDFHLTFKFNVRCSFCIFSVFFSFKLYDWHWFHKIVPKLNIYRMRSSVYWCCCHKRKHSICLKIDYNVCLIL